MTVTTASLEQRGAGRPRSLETERAILDAAVDLLVEVGFGGMSMEALAARAGVGKAAIYRRWASKEQVVVESLKARNQCHVPLNDTGDLRADLLAMLEGIRRTMIGEDGPIMTAFVSEKARHPELRAEFERVFVTERRAHVRQIIGAAVERGELPTDTDIDLVGEAGPAILFHHMMVHDRQLDADLPQRIVALLLGSDPSLVS